MPDLSQNTLNVIIGSGILVGAVQCFFGYRVFKFFLWLYGFVLGGGVAGIIGYALSQEEVVALLAGLVGGFIGGALMVALYFLGVFLMGAWLGGTLGAVLFAVAESHPEPVVLLIFAVIAGVIALCVEKFMIIVSTAFCGAFSVVTGVEYFLTPPFFRNYYFERMFRSDGGHVYTILLCWLILGFFGVIVQWTSTPPKEEEAQRSAAPEGEEGAALLPEDAP